MMELTFRQEVRNRREAAATRAWQRAAFSSELATAVRIPAAARLLRLVTDAALARVLELVPEQVRIECIDGRLRLSYRGRSLFME